MIMAGPNEVQAKILMGWRQRHDGRRRTIGLHTAHLVDQSNRGSESSDSDPLYYEGDSHLMTFAPTGAGKGRGVIIPTLLDYPGSVVVIDPKGENYRVTGRARREMGQQVVVLDPFGKVTDSDRPSDRFNVLDIFDLPGTIADADSLMLSWQIAGGQTFSKDPFWDNSGTALLYGLISHVVTALPKEERNLNRVLKYVYNDDVIYNLAALLDSKSVKCPHAYREIAAFLQLPERDTRPSVLATAISWVKAMNTQCVENVLQSSTFPLEDLLHGRPISIYLVIPPEKLHSYKALLRLWVSALTTTVLRRTCRPALSTLFLLDEAAQLGTMPLLEQAVTLLRGYGLQVWTFWQDVEQIQANYPGSYRTLINNASALQTFGISNSSMASQLAEILDCSAGDLLKMSATEARIFIRGHGSETTTRPDYLNDKRFAGRFDSNPFFASPTEAVHPPRRSHRK